MPYSSQVGSVSARAPNVVAAEALAESIGFEIEAIATQVTAGIVLEASAADAFVARVLDSYAMLTRLDDELEPKVRRAVVARHRALLLPRFLAVPMVRHSVERPLGYPGDYQIVEMIFGAGPGADSPLGRLLERVVLEAAPSAAHRYRAPWTSAWLDRRAAEASEPLRVMSFACGPERVLRAHAQRGAAMNVTLCDHDGRALAHAGAALEAQLAGRGSVACRQLSAISLIRGREEAALVGTEPFDAILVLGLFDYLREPVIRRMLRRFHALLRPGGILLASNVAVGNPHRSLMEYIGDWGVIHRSAGDFEQLMVDRTGLTALELRTDPTGANLLFAGRRA
jgi:extracellular factor (EF) 3-hydroxypalmitic acid methyl ester biosynthesis protein